MIRILILILAFNAFIPSAFSQGVCTMPMESTMEQASMASDHCQLMKQMDEDVDRSCCSFDCASDCASQLSPFTLSYETPALLLGANGRPQTALPHFYSIILPIKTPPPLA